MPAKHRGEFPEGRQGLQLEAQPPGEENQVWLELPAEFQELAVAVLLVRQGVILEKIDPLGKNPQVMGQVIEGVDDVAVKGGVHQVGHEDPGVAPQLLEGPGQPGAHRRPGDVHHDDDASGIVLLQDRTLQSIQGQQVSSLFNWRSWMSFSTSWGGRHRTLPNCRAVRMTRAECSSFSILL